jgi:hypothetical protein
MIGRSMSVRLSVALLFSAWLGIASSIAAQPVNPSNVSPSIAQIVKMHESGVAADVLLAYVKETPISKPGAEEVLYLTEKGISKDVIVTLLSKRVWADNVAPQSQPAPVQTQAQAQTQLPPAVAATQPASQSVVYVQQPAPPVTYVTPAPYYYSPWYYDPWPRFSIGIGLGHGWYGGHHWHGHGGIHGHRH